MFNFISWIYEYLQPGTNTINNTVPPTDTRNMDKDNLSSDSPNPDTENDTPIVDSVDSASNFETDHQADLNCSSEPLLTSIEMSNHSSEPLNPSKPRPIQIDSNINIASISNLTPNSPPDTPPNSPNNPEMPSLSNMTLSDLPNDCLELILRQIALEERIHLRGVCTQWFFLIEEMCHRVHTLQLFGNQKNITDYCLTLINHNTFDSEEMKLKPIGEDTDLMIEGANPKIVFTFTTLFPNLEHLIVHLSWDCHFETLRLWIMQFPRLQSLTICGFMEHQEDRFLERFLPTLDDLDGLTRLHFLTTNFFLYPNGDSAAIQLPKVLTQLEEFSIANYTGNLYTLLRQLDAHKCKKLRLDLVRDETNEIELPQLIEFNRTLMANLTHLRLALPKTSQINGVIPVICQNMPSLQCLDIQSSAVMNFEMVKLDSTFISEMNRLLQLRELRLSHVGLDLLEFDFEVFQLVHIRRLHLSQFTLYPTSRPPTDASFRSSLYIKTSTEGVLWSALAFLCPRLEELYVRVARESIAPIEEQMGKFFQHLHKFRIYSVEDLAKGFFGRHPPYEYEESEEMDFFSEYFFDKIKKL